MRPPSGADYCAGRECLRSRPELSRRRAARRPIRVRQQLCLRRRRKLESIAASSSSRRGAPVAPTASTSALARATFPSSTGTAEDVTVSTTSAAAASLDCPLRGHPPRRQDEWRSRACGSRCGSPPALAAPCRSACNVRARLHAATRECRGLRAIRARSERASAAQNRSGAHLGDQAAIHHGQRLACRAAQQFNDGHVRMQSQFIVAWIESDRLHGHHVAGDHGHDGKPAVLHSIGIARALDHARRLVHKACRKVNQRLANGRDQRFVGQGVRELLARRRTCDPDPRNQVL